MTERDRDARGVRLLSPGTSSGAPASPAPNSAPPPGRP